MKQFFANKYVQGITQYIKDEHFGPRDYIDWYCEQMGLTREEYMAGYRIAMDLRLAENKKPGPDPYHTGLDDDDVEDKEEQVKKQAEMDDDDPDAYKEMPGDKEAREKGKVKTSEFTKKYHELYGESESNESVVTEAKPAGLTKEETLKVAQKFADAIAEVDGVKVTVNMKTLEEDSFDLDYDGTEFDGGSYNINADGSVVNMAVRKQPTVGTKDDDVKTIVKFMKKHYGKLAKNESAVKVAESLVNEAVVLKKGDTVKFKNGSIIYILGPKGDGYDYRDGREKGHHSKEWFDMMISSGKAVVESVVTEGKMPDKYIGNDEIVFLKTKEDSRGANYNLYYKGHDIDAGGRRFGSEKELKDFAANYILSNQWYNKLRYADAKPLPESVINEEKAEGDRSPIGNPDIEKALKKKADDTGVPIGILRIIMRRGMAAWKSGHRPGAGQEQWGYARVNAFLTKGEGTWGDADKDVAKEVRDGGHDKKLKKA